VYKALKVFNVPFVSRDDSPKELEQSPVPAQERAGRDDVQGLRPCGIEADKHKHDEAIAVLDLRMIYGASKHDELLAQ
jgi:hypothetical protein